MRDHNQLIQTLVRSRTFRTYERAYTEAIGMPLTLHPPHETRLPFHGQQKENAFCGLMAGRMATCAACLQLQATLERDAMDRPATRTCAYGLCETAVPVKVGARTIGFLRTGQVMRKAPTGASFRRAVNQARKCGADIGNEKTRRAYFKTPIASQRKLDSVSSLLASFADHLATKSNQIAVEAANAEPPSMTRVKLFIRDHSTEPLSLRQVSSLVNMSRSHFCRVFHRSTSVTFTEFVSRIRIEKAKDLLLDAHLQISEIAFAVGFQSLTNFNRVFRTIMGQSPTHYRDQLAAPA